MNRDAISRWIVAACLLGAAVGPSRAQQAANKPLQPPSAAKTAPADGDALTHGPDSNTKPLSVEEAVRIGLARNPQTAAGEAGEASAEANYRSLKSFPPLTLGVTRAQGSSTAPTLTGENRDTMFDLGAVFDTSGQRRLQAAGAKSQFHASEFNLEETRLSLAQQIRDAYWSFVAAEAQAAMAEENLHDVQHVHQLILTQQQAGAAPEVDVIRSSVDVANAQQANMAAQAAERTALAAFNSLLARDPSAPVRLADSFTSTTTAPALLRNLPVLSDLNRTALANRPLIKSARAQVETSRYALLQAKAARRPDVTVNYQRSIEQSIDTLLIGAQLPVLNLGSIRYSIQSAAAAVDQSRAQQKQAEQQVVQQVARARIDYAQAQQQIAGYQTDILAPSTKLLDLAKIGYAQGATGILAVIDAETTLRNARTGYVSDLLALYQAYDELMAATGESLPSAHGASQAAATNDRLGLESSPQGVVNTLE